MSVVPQAANSGVSSPLFGGPTVSPHLDNSRSDQSLSQASAVQRADETRTIENAGGCHNPLNVCQDAQAASQSALGASLGSTISGESHATVKLSSKHFAGSEPQTASREAKAGEPMTSSSGSRGPGKPPRKLSAGRKTYHRVAEVRIQQGVSERTMARRLGMDLKSYRELEDPTHDLTISQLAKLQEALDVPIADLLEDHHALSRPVQERAKLLKVMKTAVALKEAKINPRTDRIAQMLCEQLVDLMPELADVSGWPQFGARRGVSAIGKVLQNPIDTSGLTLPE